MNVITSNPLYCMVKRTMQRSKISDYTQFLPTERTLHCLRTRYHLNLLKKRDADAAAVDYTPSLFDHPFDKPFVYLAQPLANPPWMLRTYKQNMEATIDTAANMLGLDQKVRSFHAALGESIQRAGLDLLNPADPSFNYVSYDVLSDESVEDVGNLIVETDCALIYHADLVILDATYNYGVGATMEITWAHHLGIPVLAVVPDAVASVPDTVSVWLRRHTTAVICESDIVTKWSTYLNTGLGQIQV